MADKKEIIQKLDALLKKSEQFQQDLKDLNNVILYSGILEEKPLPESIPPVNDPVTLPKVVLMEDLQVTAPPIVIPPVEPVVIPVAEPKNIQPVQPEKEKEPEPAYQPAIKAGFDYIGEKKKTEEPVKVKTPAPKAVKKTFFEKNPDLEKFIGERLITFIGIAILFTGIAFFVKYAIDKDWINETGRSFIGVAAGGILIAIAHRLRKNFRTFSSVLIGGGIAVEYFTITYSHHVYHLFPGQVTALALLVCITLFTVLLAILYDRQELAVIAITGGFLTPLMISDGSGQIGSLGAYVLILDVGMLALAYFKRWNAINFISYFFTVLLFGGALTNEFLHKPNPPYALALGYATAFYLVFFMMNIVNNVKSGTKFKAGEIVVLLSNTMLYYAAGYYILDHIGEKPYHGIFTLCVAVFNFVFAYLLYKRQTIDRNLIYLLIGIVITFISLAGPVQLDGNNITLFWAAETVLLLWLYQRSNITLLSYASMAVNVLMLGSLVLANWVNSNMGLEYFTLPTGGDIDQPFMSNRFFITSLFALASLMATHFLLTRQKTDEIIPGLKLQNYKRFIGITVLAIGYLSFFMEFYTQMEINHFGLQHRVVCLAAYSALFTAVFIAVMRFRNFDHMKAIAIIMGLGVMVLYVFYFNMAVVDVRDGMLVAHTLAGVYYLHYLLTALVVTIAVYLFLEIRRSKQYQSLFNAYLWFLCILGVFIVSAEIDHAIITMGYGNGHYIPDLRSISGNIAYPVAWGICSFVMMVVGMRKQMRQLRIISLVLFAITIVKLIWLGVNGDSEAGKIIAFIVSGIVLMVVAFMYQKLKKLITEEDKPTETVNHE